MTALEDEESEEDKIDTDEPQLNKHQSFIPVGELEEVKLVPETVANVNDAVLLYHDEDEKLVT